MAQSASRNDPYPAFNFQINFDDVSAGGFTECSGLQIETEVQDYPEGGQNSFIHRRPGRSTQSNITLKRGIVNRELWDWYLELVHGAVRFKRGTIVVRDATGTRDVMVWHLRNAFPRKWVGPELNASQSQVAVETLELAHQGFDRAK